MAIWDGRSCSDAAIWKIVNEIHKRKSDELRRVVMVPARHGMSHVANAIPWSAHALIDEREKRMGINADS